MSKVYEFGEMADKHPLLKTSNLEGVTSIFEQAQNNYMLARRMPMTTVNADKVEFDQEKVTRGGLTPKVTPGQESPIYNNPIGRARQKFEPASFREKCILKSNELKELRKLGTYEDVITAREMLRQRFSSLEARLANRLEWMRKQMIFDQQVSIETEGGQAYTVNYPHPDYLEPTFGTTWDQDAATPMRDLQKIIDDYERHTSKDVVEILMPHDIMDDLIDNQRVLTIADNNYETFDGSPADIRRGISNYLDIGSIQVSKDSIHFTTTLASDAAQGATSLTFTRTPKLEAGDEFILHNVQTRDRELFEVASISGNTVQLVGSVDRSGGFVANDHAKYQKYTIPSTHLLVLGQGRADMQRSDEGSLVPNYQDRPWAEVVSTLARFPDLENPTPGMYTKSFDKTDEDPPRIEQALGINCLTKLNDQDAFMLPKVR